MVDGPQHLTQSQLIVNGFVVPLLLVVVYWNEYIDNTYPDWLSYKSGTEPEPPEAYITAEQNDERIYAQHTSAAGERWQKVNGTRC
jgi:hypothetical protein